eukprot:52696-Pyramimonas_sp.AAC.1
MQMQGGCFVAFDVYPWLRRWINYVVASVQVRQIHPDVLCRLLLAVTDYTVYVRDETEPSGDPARGVTMPL